MHRILIPTLTILALTLGVAAAHAIDTDIFVRNPVVGGKPNILLMIDNSADWNAVVSRDGRTRKALTHEAAYRFIDALDPELEVNLGIMIHAQGNRPRGGKILHRVQPLTPLYREQLLRTLYSREPTDSNRNGRIDPAEFAASDRDAALETSNNAPLALALNEAYLYFAGEMPASGAQPRDSRDLLAVNPLTGRYVSPVNEAFNCADNHVIVVGGGDPDSGENNAARTQLARIGEPRDTEPVDLPGDSDLFESSWADEYARFLSRTDANEGVSGDQLITVSVIDIHDRQSRQSGTRPFRSARTLLRSIAEQGDGLYAEADSAGRAFEAMLASLGEVNNTATVFAGSASPVSRHNPGRHVNEVYLGMFRPDELNRPRWWGNLKAYQLGLDAAGAVVLTDARGEPARSERTGFILPESESFWSHASNDWEFSPRGNPASASDLPDGEVVEKGGAAQQLRDRRPEQRKVLTCTGNCSAGSLLSATPFSRSNASLTAPRFCSLIDTAGNRGLPSLPYYAQRTNLDGNGVIDAIDCPLDELVDWVRGRDVFDANHDGSRNDMRPDVHADVLHAQPLAVNYARDGSDTDSVIFYGTNGGTFHAVHGGLDGTRGTELWSFVAEEFFRDLKTLYDNEAQGFTTQFRPHFFDGTATVLEQDVNRDGRLVAADGDRVLLYIPVRRGGRFIYALDVSDPEEPRFLWKRSSADRGYTELGQTWSRPRVAHVRTSDHTGPVLVFGAGYDAAVDDIPASSPTDTVGRGVMVVNALTGELIWQVGPAPAGARHNLRYDGMTHSFPAEVTVVDGNRDRYADRVYATDSGGSIWRIDVADPDPARWVVSRLAQLGDHGNLSLHDNREFFNAPDVVAGRDERGPYYAILTGSGDRENPLGQTTQDRFYMIRDRAVAPLDPEGPRPALITDLGGSRQLYDATQNLVQGPDRFHADIARAELAAADGWYINLGSGEKVVSRSLTLNHTAIFSTMVPGTPLACSNNPGEARTYAVDLASARSVIEQDGRPGLDIRDRYARVAGGGFGPRPEQMVVELDGQMHEVVVAGTRVIDPPSPALFRREKIYWYQL